jgi:hypothetical protein
MGLESRAPSFPMSLWVQSTLHHCATLNLCFISYSVYQGLLTTEMRASVPRMPPNRGLLNKLFFTNQALAPNTTPGPSMSTVCMRLIDQCRLLFTEKLSWDVGTTGASLGKYIPPICYVYGYELKSNYRVQG